VFGLETRRRRAHSMDRHFAGGDHLGLKFGQTHTAAGDLHVERPAAEPCRWR
jgi:hypothetical protein